MLHTKIINIKDKKLSIVEAEKFISSSDFGASIFFSERWALVQLMKHLTLGSEVQGQHYYIRLSCPQREPS